MGVQAPNLNREPDDHLGFEFHFLGLVCNLALDALDKGDMIELDRSLETQKRFLGDHLSPGALMSWHVWNKRQRRLSTRALGHSDSEYSQRRVLVKAGSIVSGQVAGPEP